MSHTVCFLPSCSGCSDRRASAGGGGRGKNKGATGPVARLCLPRTRTRPRVSAFPLPGREHALPRMCPVQAQGSPSFCFALTTSGYLVYDGSRKCAFFHVTCPGSTGAMATRASTSHLAASDRLYLTPTGYTRWARSDPSFGENASDPFSPCRAEKKVLEATHFSRTAHGIETEAVEKAVGKTAKVTQIPEHGLVIVRHEAARRGQVGQPRKCELRACAATMQSCVGRVPLQKQNTELTSTGRRRNDAGGFYSS